MPRPAQWRCHVRQSITRLDGALPRRCQLPAHAANGIEHWVRAGERALASETTPSAPTSRPWWYSGRVLNFDFENTIFVFIFAFKNRSSLDVSSFDATSSEILPDIRWCTLEIDI